MPVLGSGFSLIPHSADWTFQPDLSPCSLKKSWKSDLPCYWAGLWPGGVRKAEWWCSRRDWWCDCPFGAVTGVTPDSTVTALLHPSVLCCRVAAAVQSWQTSRARATALFSINPWSFLAQGAQWGWAESRVMACSMPPGADKNGIFLMVEQSQGFPHCRWRGRDTWRGKWRDEGHKTKLRTAFMNLISV